MKKPKHSKEFLDVVFKAWKIKHLSPSSINTFISDPALWTVRYLLDHRTESSPAMFRGTTVDNSVGLYFGVSPTGKSRVTPRSVTQIQNDALLSFDHYRGHLEKEKKWDDSIHYDKWKKEKDLICRYVKTAIDFYADMDSQPDSYQEEVFYESKYLPIPIYGKSDLTYEKDGVVRDIKTVSRRTSENSFAINRQLALYGTVLGLNPIADYILCNKSSADVTSVECKNVKESLDELERGAMAIANYLSISTDINDLLGLHFPNYDDFKWSELRDDKSIRSLWRKIK